MPLPRGVEFFPQYREFKFFSNDFSAEQFLSIEMIGAI